MTSSRACDASPVGSGNAADGEAAPDVKVSDALFGENLLAEWDADKAPAAGPVTNIVVAIVIAAIGIGGIYLALDMGIGSPSSPSSGLWPLMIGVVLVGLAITMALLSRRFHDGEKFSPASLQVLIGVVTMIGFVLLIGRIGFELPALVLMFIWLRFMGKESWRMSITLSIVTVAAFYLIFVVALGVPVPHLF